MTSPVPAGRPASAHKVTALAVASVFMVMLGMAYASVPLYRAFCRATGYGGTPQVAVAGPLKNGTRTVSVRFDANVAPGLAWRFEPEVPQIELRTGTTATVYFKVTNQTDRPVAARALYNVSPDVAGFYFNKISCFCFEEQHLGPHETAEWPVVFFVDPALETDASLKALDALTLSYTLYAAPSVPAVAATEPRRSDPGRL